MPKKNHRGEKDFQKYDAMTSEELSHILRLDSEAPEGDAIDIDTLLYITGVLAEREKNTGKTPHEAWNSFQQNYMPSEEEMLVAKEQEKPAKTRNTWACRAIAAAAAVALVVFIPLTAKALDWEKIWNTVATWAKETFSFSREDQPANDEPTPNNSRQYASLTQALEQMGMDPDLVPDWIPGGYVLDRVDVDETPTQRNFVALYKNKEQHLNICVRSYVDYAPEKIEINEDLIEIYEVSGVEYYIFANNKRIRAIWIQGSYECYISGEFSLEEMKKMIDSIPKG